MFTTINSTIYFGQIYTIYKIIIIKTKGHRSCVKISPLRECVHLQGQISRIWKILFYIFKKNQ